MGFMLPKQLAKTTDGSESPSRRYCLGAVEPANRFEEVEMLLWALVKKLTQYAEIVGKPNAYSPTQLQYAVEYFERHGVIGLDLDKDSEIVKTRLPIGMLPEGRAVLKLHRKSVGSLERGLAQQKKRAK